MAAGALARAGSLPLISCVAQGAARGFGLQVPWDVSCGSGGSTSVTVFRGNYFGSLAPWPLPAELRAASSGG